MAETEELVKKYGRNMGLITTTSWLDKLREGEVKSFKEQIGIFNEYRRTEEGRKQLVEAIGTAEYPEFLNRQVQLTIFKNYEMTPDTWTRYAQIKDSTVEVEQYFEMNSSGNFVEVSSERDKAPEVQFSKGSFNWIRNKLFRAKLEFTYKFMLYNDKYQEFFDQAALFGKMARKIQNSEVLAALQSSSNFGAQVAGSTTVNNAGSSPLGLIGLDEAELYFLTLKDLAGDPIEIDPDTIVIPPALWAVLQPIVNPESSILQQFVTSTNKNTKSVPMINTYRGRFTNIIIERRMTSATQWYVFSQSLKPVVYQRVMDLTVVPHPFNNLPMGNIDNGMTLSWEAFIGFGAGVPAAHRRFLYRGNSA